MKGPCSKAPHSAIRVSRAPGVSGTLGWSTRECVNGTGLVFWLASLVGFVFRFGWKTAVDTPQPPSTLLNSVSQQCLDIAVGVS